MIQFLDSIYKNNKRVLYFSFNGYAEVGTGLRQITTFPLQWSAMNKSKLQCSLVVIYDKMLNNSSIKCYELSRLDNVVATVNSLSTKLFAKRKVLNEYKLEKEQSTKKRSKFNKRQFKK